MASAEATEVVEPVLGLETLAPVASLLAADDEILLEEEVLLDEEALVEDEILDTLEEVARFWMIAECTTAT